MKKVMAFTMAAVMAASMTACSGSGEPAAETEKSTAAETTAAVEEKETEAAGEEKAADGDITVGVSLLNSTHVFYNNIQTAMEAAAEETVWKSW